ncbi:MAG: deoxyribonuclease IV [Candidatus Lokiarchaeota archaeon]|nr:deoxyribonuclease IV [Candidatus Lokiarchaeota archaeon]
MSISGGKHKALERGRDIGCETIQLFVRNARSWSSKSLGQEEINKFRKIKEDNSEIYPLISHNSYLINLATNDKEKLKKSYNAMLDELTKAEQLKLDYINIHPGSKDPDEKDSKALLRIADQLNILLNEVKNSKVVILLETTSGQGNYLGYCFEHFISIIDEIDNKNRIGVTFDTCHSYAAGYDFSNIKKYYEMWESFDEIIGIEYLYAFHLNDSVRELNSRIDRHIHIGEGKIGLEGFRYLINDDRFKDIPGILETPKGEDVSKDIMNLKTLRSLKKK